MDDPRREEQIGWYMEGERKIAHLPLVRDLAPAGCKGCRHVRWPTLGALVYDDPPHRRVFATCDVFSEGAYSSACQSVRAWRDDMLNPDVAIDSPAFRPCPQRSAR